LAFIARSIPVIFAVARLCPPPSIYPRDGRAELFFFGEINKE